MTAAELDVAYTHLCRAVAAVDQSETEHFLARLALLLIADTDPERVTRAITDAVADIA